MFNIFVKFVNCIIIGCCDCNGWRMNVRVDIVVNVKNDGFVVGEIVEGY
jgi:hypothetical protein